MSERDTSYARLRDHKLANSLPCRGCMPDCSNRQHCQGRPWRLAWTNPGQATANGDKDPR